MLNEKSRLRSGPATAPARRGPIANAAALKLARLHCAYAALDSKSLLTIPILNHRARSHVVPVMRRYHAASRVLRTSAFSKPTAADISFLLEQPRPNTRHATGPVDEGAWNSSGLSSTAAMKRLSNAVRHRKYAVAETLFQTVPALGTRQSALRLLIKMYCEQQDFTTAKAVLYASLDKVGDRGVARFISHCTFGSQKASDIEEAYLRWCAAHEPTPQLAEIALLGTRFLGDLDAFERVWSRTAEFWEPSLKAPTLMSKVLDLLLKESWEDASRTWRIAAGMGSFADVRPLQVFYIACRYFLVENPSVDAVNAILRMMREHELQLTPQFTALLLRYLAPLFPETPVTDWIDAARQRDWPLSGHSVDVLVHTLARRFDSAPEFSSALYRHGLRRMTEAGLAGQQRPLAEGSHRTKELRRLQASITEAQVFENLRSTLSRGLQIPYYHFVVAFRLLAGWRSSRLPELVSFMQEQGYPVHCSGTDLAVVELQCREAQFNPILCKQLIAEYLVQYPLIGHSLSQLTQLGLIMWHAGDFRTAQMLVDSIRAEQSESQKYTGANHDSASLQLILRCRLSVGEGVVLFVRSVLADQPSIIFDNEFVSTLREMLDFRSEDRSVLDEVARHNADVQARCYAQTDELINLARAAIDAQPRPAKREGP